MIRTDPKPFQGRLQGSVHVFGSFEWEMRTTSSRFTPKRWECTQRAFYTGWFAVQERVGWGLEIGPIYTLDIDQGFDVPCGFSLQICLESLQRTDSGQWRWSFVSHEPREYTEVVFEP